MLRAVCTGAHLTPASWRTARPDTCVYYRQELASCLCFSTAGAAGVGLLVQSSSATSLPSRTCFIYLCIGRSKRVPAMPCAAPDAAVDVPTPPVAAGEAQSRSRWFVATEIALDGILMGAQVALGITGVHSGAEACLCCSKAVVVHVVACFTALYTTAASAVVEVRTRRGTGLQRTILGLSVESACSHTASLRSRRASSAMTTTRCTRYWRDFRGHSRRFVP